MPADLQQRHIGESTRNTSLLSFTLRHSWQDAFACRGLLEGVLDTEEVATLAALVVRRAVGPALAMPTVAGVLRERASSGSGLAVLANLGERGLLMRPLEVSTDLLAYPVQACGCGLIDAFVNA